ncbi:hypothetical protein ACFL5G_03465 [Candidatus Margulisiibacteriota bacterium]
MYDYYFGDEKKIKENEIKYLVAIKHMLPRRINSISDAEFISLYENLNASLVADTSSNGVLVETGSGASTILFIYFAYKYNKVLYTWDINQFKLAEIRSVVLDTIEKHFKKSLHVVWNYIPSFSTSKDIGIDVIGELGLKIDFGFFDSDHTEVTLHDEIRSALKYANPSAVFAIDDATFTCKHKNLPYINILRKKIGLPAIKDSSDNKTAPFYESVEKLIKDACPQSKKLTSDYSKLIKDDLFFKYYNFDFQASGGDLKMVNLDSLAKHYCAYQIIK